MPMVALSFDHPALEPQWGAMVAVVRVAVTEVEDGQGKAEVEAVEVSESQPFHAHGKMTLVDLSVKMEGFGACASVAIVI